MSNSTDDVGVNRQSVTKMDAGPNGIFVVRSTMPACTSRVPFYTTEAWIAVVPIEGKVTAGELDVNGTTVMPTLSTFGPDSVMIRGPNILSTIYNEQCTPATYIAFYTSAKFKTVFIPYVLPQMPSFTLNATYADQAGMLRTLLG